MRSVDPPIAEVQRRRVTELRRLGKRIVIGLEPDLFLILHLMIAGRLHWKERGAKLPRKVGLAAFDFTNGTLTLTDSILTGNSATTSGGGIFSPVIRSIAHPQALFT